MPGLVPGAAWATLDDLEPATNKLHDAVSLSGRMPKTSSDGQQVGF